jgi:RNA polymerase sigma factor (sigma-70 family)
MAEAQMDLVLRHLRRLAARQDVGPLSDGQLLERFCRHRDEDAFAELVGRHGPMVLGVCRTLLHNAHDAEDAFQATFLVLVRKARAIRSPDAVGGWLYRVAYHLAGRAAADPRAPRFSERETPDMAAADPLLDMTVRELRQAVHEELDRLPAQYQAPLVLCYLEGRTYDEAARQLGWTKGTLRGRLNRARARLRDRLTRRGLALSAEFLAFGPASSEAALPRALAEATVQAGLLFRAGKSAGTVGPLAAALAEHGLRTVFLGPIKGGLLMLVLAGLLTAAAVAHQLTGQRPEVPGVPAPAAVRVDPQGDPLPDEAISRLGTTRFRSGDGVFFVRFTADGKRIVSQGRDGVRTWDRATGKQLHAFPKDRTASLGEHGASLSADGTLLATGSRSGIYLWDLASARSLRTFAGDGSLLVRLSPDGRLLAAHSADGSVHLLDATTGQEHWSIREGHNWMPIGFSADGKSFLAARFSAIKFFGAATGAELRQIELGPECFPYRVLPSRDGTLLAAVCEPARDERLDRYIRAWDLTTGRELPRLEPSTRIRRDGQWSFSALAFAPDNKLLTAGSDDGLSLWDLGTGKLRRRLGRDTIGACDLDFAPDGKAVALGHRGCIRLLDPASGNDLFPMRGYWDYMGSTVISPDGRSVVTASSGPVPVIVWDTTTGTERRRFAVPADQFVVQVTDDARTAVSARPGDDTVYAWDLATGKERYRLSSATVHHWPVFSAASGRAVLALCGANGESLDLVEAATGKPLRQIPVRVATLWYLHFTANGRTLVACQDDHTAEVWDVVRGVKLRQLTPTGKANNNPGYWTALSPDGRRLAYTPHVYAPEMAYLLILDVATGEPLLRLTNLPDRPESLCFSPDGRTLAWCGPGAPVIHLLELASGRERHTLAGHRGPARCFAFSPDGSSLVSASADATALVWDLSGRLAGKGAWDRPPTAAELDSCWAALAGDDAARAYKAIRRLAASPTAAVSYLAGRLRPVRPADEARLAGLIANLDSSRFAVRDQAARELEALGDTAVAACRRALAGRPSAEARRRLEAFLNRQAHEGHTPSGENLRLFRALEVLELAETAEARRLLGALAAGASEAWQTREAAESLERLSGRPLEAR